jgi:hypothetical protein
MFHSGADGPLDFERLLLNTLHGVRRKPNESASTAEGNDFKLWETARATIQEDPNLLRRVALHLEQLVLFHPESKIENDPNKSPQHKGIIELLKFLTGEFHYDKRGRKAELIQALSALHGRRFVWGEKEVVKDLQALLERLEWPHLIETDRCHFSGVPVDSDNVVEVPTRIVGLREELPSLRLHPVVGRHIAELRYKRQLTCSVTGTSYEGNVDFLNPHAGVPFDLLPVSPHFVRELQVLDTTYETFGITLSCWVAKFRSPRMKYVGFGRVD